MFTDPEKNVMEFGFIPGQKVADLGTGAGHYASALSRSLGENGRVYAIDLNKDILVRLKKGTMSDGKQNVEVIWGDVEKPHGTKLKDGAVDGTVFSNILFQLGDKKNAVDEANRILKPGGKACVVEWKNKLPEGEVKELFVTMGFNFEKSFEAGESHYGLIFKKPLQ